MTDGGFTSSYEPAGVVHSGEFIVPAPYDYPKWTKWVWPKALRTYLNRKFRKYNRDKDLLLKMTGVKWMGEL